MAVIHNNFSLIPYTDFLAVRCVAVYAQIAIIFISGASLSGPTAEHAAFLRASSSSDTTTSSLCSGILIRIRSPSSTSAIGPEYQEKFVKVIPKEYKLVTQKLNEYLQQGMSADAATLKVFEEVKA